MTIASNHSGSSCYSSAGAEALHTLSVWPAAQLLLAKRHRAEQSRVLPPLSSVFSAMQMHSLTLTLSLSLLGSTERRRRRHRRTAPQADRLVFPAVLQRFAPDCTPPKSTMPDAPTAAAAALYQSSRIAHSLARLPFPLFHEAVLAYYHCCCCCC